MMARHSLPKDLKALQDGLIQFYEQNKSRLPIAPLVEHHNAPVVDIYVLPRMMIADKPTFGKRIDDSKKISIYQYKDLFEDQDKHQFKKIFITAGGGMGKSAFIRKMILTWCQAQNADKNIDQIDKNFQNDDIKTMKNFTFLFLLELCYSENCDIDFMIQTLVENNIGGVSGTTLETALNKYQCLVLLDGLDKWRHQRGCSQKNPTCHGGVNMPYNTARGKVTLVTTSRPWRVIRLKSNDVDRHVELSNLTRRASQQLESNVINFFEKLRSSEVSEVKIQQNIDEFDAKVAASELEDVRCTPYILLQELCLWAEGKKIRKSKFEAYKYTIELTLEKALEGNEPEEKDKQVPDYFSSTIFCKTYYHSMLELGQLAFRIQCREIIDKSYKMTLKEAKSCVHDLDFYKKAGILSETKDHGCITKIETFISFQEKAFQEFFAALYMTHGWNNTSERQTIVQECLGLPNVMEMSNVLSFVRDLNTEWHGDIYNAVVKRTDLMKYISDSKQKVSHFGGTFVQFDATEMKTIVEDYTGDKRTEGCFGPECKYKGYMLDTNYGKLCVKKVKVQKEPRKAILNALKQELLTSKLLHPYLLSAVTLLRKVSEDEETFYLLTPYCQTLHETLTGKNGMKLKWYDKVRISLQVALGIQYLHTPLKGDRKTWTHKNVCTTNIMLDTNKNARLICHGIGRDQEVAQKHQDYNNFGKVIQKLFTTEEPKRAGDSNNESKKSKETEILELADMCVLAGEPFEFKTKVIDKLQEWYQEGDFVCLHNFDVRDIKRCSFCMINVAAAGAKAEIQHSDNCTGKKSLNICFTCEQNLHFNPLKCVGCDEPLRPAIGVGWGAILVAGNDTEEQPLAESFTQDLEDIKKLVMCQTPLIMGIRDVKVIKPRKPGERENLTEKLRNAIAEIKEQKERKEIHTLLLYFSCHGKDKGETLQLGSKDDLLDKKDLERRLKDIGLDKVIIFMDHCYPTNIQLGGTTRTIQLNACKPDKQTSGGSPFTKYFIEAVIDKATRSSGNSTEGAYLTATNLLERVTQLFKQNMIQTEPLFYIPDSSRCEDIHIAYCNLQSLEVTFYHNTTSETVQVNVLHSMMDIKKDICLTFEKEEKMFVEIFRKTARRRVNTDGTLAEGTGETVSKSVDKVQDIILAHILQERLEVVFTENQSS